MRKFIKFTLPVTLFALVATPAIARQAAPIKPPKKVSGSHAVIDNGSGMDRNPKLDSSKKKFPDSVFDRRGKKKFPDSVFDPHGKKKFPDSIYDHKQKPPGGR